MIESLNLAKGWRSFSLDMGKPIKIFDLAKKNDLFKWFIKDENNPSGDIEIKIIGLRKGEKFMRNYLLKPNHIKQNMKKYSKE